VRISDVLQLACRPAFAVEYWSVLPIVLVDNVIVECHRERFILRNIPLWLSEG
jgi:hypothetical protein